ncbi:MAG: hypothetical protein AB7Y46_15590 [Armatimonadota bacterium]
MIRRWWTVLVAVAALAAMGLTIALIAGGLRRGEGKAVALTRQAAQALDRVPVRGTVCTVTLTPHGPIEVRAQVHRGEGRVHIRYLSGPAQGMQVYRQRERVWVTGPRGQVRRSAELTEGGWQEELLARNWRFRIAGSTVVAGRPATVVVGGGPGGGIRLATDRETGFPLAIMRSAPDGRVLTATTWEQVDFGVPAPPELEAPPRARGPGQGRRMRMSLAELRTAVDFALLEPGWLPPGFVHQDWYLHEGRRGVMAESRYTDGLRALLVLQRAAGTGAAAGQGGLEHPGGGGLGQHGRRDHSGPPGRTMRLRGAGGDAVRRQIGGTDVTVIGPLQVTTLERIADSLEPTS